MHGTSKNYIINRLQREGLTHFIAGIESGRVSAHAIAVHLGWVRRRPTRGGSPNERKRRQHQLVTLLREARRDTRR